MIKRALSPTATNKLLIRSKCEKHNLEAGWKELNDELIGHLTSPTDN